MELDRVAPTFRPAGNAIGYQSWRDLSFLHWRVPAESVSPHLPHGLHLDLWNGECWIGLVPFRMRSVRPAGLPSLPYISYFLETNLRTYVHDGERPGVWFFSLEASRWIAVTIARLKWNLNYFWAQMRFSHEGEQYRYRSNRWRGTTEARTDFAVQVDSTHGTFQATPGTLEHFLAERYILFAHQPKRGLYWGQVHHAPYPLQRAQTMTYQETLSTAARIPGLHHHNTKGPEHVLFSPGVDVEIFALQKHASS